MYLKRIELQGFKSFTSKTAISFEPGISCIVGPNGSGKSNIADALRWVLGEQNARNIRGGKLEDVIFSGTKKRRPLGMAEVNIILDNSDGHLPLEMSEISVTRRAIRGEGSEYLINNKPCRLKDIRDLFVDTGIGVEGLSLINQGRINELINARPDERRALVEEAAGIVKYRDRKREAVRKLAETERHLETIGVLINELSGRIEPLRHESAKATKFLELKKAADNLEIGISVRVLSDAEDKIAALDNQLAACEEQLLEEESHRLKLSAETEALRLQLNEHDEKVEAASQSFYELQTRQEKQDGELRLAQTHQHNAAETVARLTKELTALEEAIEAKKQEVAEMTAHVERTTAEIAAEEEFILHGEGGESDIRSHIGLLADRMAELRRQLNTAVSTEAALTNQLEFKRQLSAKNTESDQKLAEEEQLLKDEAAAEQQQLSDLNKQRQRLSEESKQLSAVVNENEQQLRQLNNQIQEAAAEEADYRYRLTSATTRVTMMEEMALGYEGFFPGVKGLMTARRAGKAPSGVIGVMSELMDVPKKYRSAVEAYLGANIQNIVVEDASSAKACVAYLKKENLGRATFLPLDILKVREKPPIDAALSLKAVHGLASDLVECEAKIRPAVDFLLNSVVITEDMEVALVAAKALKYRVSVVTIDGDMVNPGASISGGSRNKKNGGLLDKKSRLAEAKAEQERLTHELAKYEDAMQQLRRLVNDGNARSEQIRAQLSAISEQISEIDHQLDQFAFTKEAREKRLAAIIAERASLESESIGIDGELEMLEQEYQECLTNKGAVETEIASIGDQLAELETQMSGQQSQLTERKVNLAASQQKLRGQTLSLERLNEDLNNLVWEAEEKAADKETAIAENEECTRQIAESEELLHHIGKLLSDAGSQLEQLKHGLAAETGRLMELEKQEKESTKKRETFQNEKYQLSVRRERWLADFENEAAKLSERFELDLEAARQRVGEIGSRTAMTTSLNQLKKEISALGDVNIGSIAEYEEVNERFTFLSGQRDDMLTARQKLDKVIEEMDKIMTSRFRDAYLQLSDAFDKSFNRLFGGGSAALYLSQPDELLETGVEIRVDPPGKKVANYNLLSGGEKSLVGIALMFAMLTVRPTPFCVMDEVDAALDEANINRFTSFLEDKAAATQFVMITHRQSTMEVASSLWGVTMEEEGVSTVVSVRLKEVAS